MTGRAWWPPSSTVLLALFMLPFVSSPAGAAATFVRGDANADRSVDLSDPVATLLALFAGGPELACRDAADADDSGTVEITDAIRTLDYLFREGQAPVSPFPDCGVDPSVDALDCEAFPSCNVNQPPRAVFTVSARTGVVPLTVEFDAGGASDPDGAITAYLWDFGDGATAAGVHAAHTYTLAGNHLARLTVRDDLGEESASTLTINARESGIPADPSIVAPPLDGTSIPSLAESVSFLHDGADPIQSGVEPEAIVALRAAVLRGRVVSRGGDPLPGVTVKVLEHPELGQTATRPDGMFDLAVNGGGALVLAYERAGYLPAQRQVDVPWQDYRWLPEVVLIPVDPRVSAIDLAGPLQAARGSPVTDADGMRQATLLVPAGTSAEMVLPNGAHQALTTLSIRATEYTVGEQGPAAMPAELPPSSAYTYCVELTVDEALAAGAADVFFSSPLPFYVENFLDFPVGTAVPLGSYDRTRGVWTPAPSGKVIEILGVNAGAADLDTDGDGLADPGAALAALAITAAERRQLAALYAPGQSLWRVRIPHFSPWDLNWPYGLPGDAVGPEGDPGLAEPLDECCPQAGNSVIAIQNQVLGESLGVVGTGFGLHYQSDRGPGYEAGYTLEIPLAGDEVPASLNRIELEVQVAGQFHQQSFAPRINQGTTFTWDGRDAYGRQLLGARGVRVRIGYTYDAVYGGASVFGAPPAVGFSLSVARQEVTLWRSWEGRIGGWDARAAGLGGWTLSAHHAYDPAARVLHLGDGRRETASARVVGPTIATVAGTGDVGSSGDGGPAAEAMLTPRGLAFGPDGSLYIATGLGFKVRRVDREGIITTVAGTGFGCPPGTACGDGGPATEAQLNGPEGLAVGPDSSLFISELGSSRVRRVGPDGIITTFAGTGVNGFSGDGGPAALATLNGPKGLAVGADGTVYIADSINNRIRRVGPDGIITTVAGGAAGPAPGDGGPAVLASIGNPQGVAVGRDGSLYLTDRGQNGVRQVTPDGIIRTIAGTGVAGLDGDGGPATEARLNLGNGGVAVGPDDTVYVADGGNNRVRWFRPGGPIDTLAGTGFAGTSGDGGLARRAALQGVEHGLALGPDGAVYFSQVQVNLRVRRISPIGEQFVAGEIAVPASDGSEVHLFTPGGRHLRTLDALTGALGYQFAYDGAARLASVTDRDGNVTSIERDGAGRPTAIVGPFGQLTELEVDGNDRLSRVTNPAGEPVALAYDGEGLLASVAQPGGQVSRYEYDALGRLLAAIDPTGARKTLARSGTNQGYTVTLTTPLGRATTYRVEHLGNQDVRLTTTDPAGIEVQALIGQDGRQTAMLPDGTRVDLVLGPDPRWGMRAPIAASLTVRTPGGKVLTTTTQRTVTLANPGDPLSLRTLSDTLTINGRVFRSVYDDATRMLTHTTPGGRRYTGIADDRGRPVQDQFGDLEPGSFTYDVLGRLTTATRGVGTLSRVTGLDYGNDGFLANVTNPMSQTTSFTTDLNGRVTDLASPDGQQVRFAYDLNGNLRGLTPPGRPEHAFNYTARDEVSSFTPPAVGAENGETRYTYDADRQPLRIDLPGGGAVDFQYDQTGQLILISLGSGDLSFGYDTAGRLNTMSTPLVSLDYAFDGHLLTGTTWRGAIAGSVTRAYDNDSRQISMSVNESPIATQYDADGLPVQVGGLVLTRAAQTGLVTATALGASTDASSYDGFGAVVSNTASQAGSAVYSEEYARDALGRITSKRETIGGVTRDFGYTYDLAGQLVEVRLGGVLAVSCAYDANGNRLSRTDPRGTIDAVYDAQDRLIQYGVAIYDHTSNGERESKSAGDLITIYEYDGLGNLTGVILPDGTQIEYLLDGHHRRVGRRVNGALVQGFLYQDRLRPIAELDGTGAVVSRFVYATGRGAPDYMVRGGVSYRIVTDQLGSPRLVLDVATGQIAQRMDHDEFGRVTLDTNPGFQPFGFAGGLYDRATALVHFGAREYDPETGRWTTRDPIGFEGGDTNLYGYVLNDPVNNIDPTGLGFDSCSTNALCLYLMATAAPVANAAAPYIQRGVQFAQRGGRAAVRAVTNLACRIGSIFSERVRILTIERQAPTLHDVPTYLLQANGAAAKPFATRFMDLARIWNELVYKLSGLDTPDVAVSPEKLAWAVKRASEILGYIPGE